MITLFGKFDGGSIINGSTSFKVMAWKRDFDKIKNKTGFFLCEERDILFHPNPEYVIKNFVEYEDVNALSTANR